MPRGAAFIIGLLFFVSIFDVFRAKVHKDDYLANELGNKYEAGELDLETQSDSDNHKDHFPILKILYCVSCGYRQAFDEFSGLLKEKYPGMKIQGGNFSPVSWKANLSRVISLAKSSLLIIILTGFNPFESLGFGYPHLLQYAHSNKLSSGLMLFMFANMLETSLSSTGAFEIYMDDSLIWSKIESGRAPTHEELMNLIEAKFNK
ncbi:hypothetical protein L3Y34_008137 [Caenorhabditis briggsae]|uniref:SelT-like protein n=1 Tax=Caenorhabditis briggsae TaxID=6238 RepID=A0AAE9D050_CAEBR|nr:hypothetical protein L3Y34_008137 [Caenorhabditis briggsae]